MFRIYLVFFLIHFSTSTHAQEAFFKTMLKGEVIIKDAQCLALNKHLEAIRLGNQILLPQGLYLDLFLHFKTLINQNVLSSLFKMPLTEGEIKTVWDEWVKELAIRMVVFDYEAWPYRNVVKMSFSRLRGYPALNEIIGFDRSAFSKFFSDTLWHLRAVYNDQVSFYILPGKEPSKLPSRSASRFSDPQVQACDSLTQLTAIVFPNDGKISTVLNSYFKKVLVLRDE